MSACCPYCQDSGKTKDTKYHLYIVPNKFVFCFKCGFKINYYKFTQRFRIDTSNLKSSPVTVDKPIGTFQSQLKSYTIDFNDSMYSRSAMGYLYKRKVTGTLIERMNIRLGADELFGRVVFIDDVNEYYLARSFLASIEPKTLNPINSVKPLFYFRKKDYNALYLVEGVFDTVPFRKTDRDVVALLGKDISQFQLTQLISVNIDNVIISLDVDAFESAKKLATIIAGKLPMINIGILMYNDRSGKDPSDYDIELFDKTSVHWIRIMSNSYEKLQT